MMQPKKVKASRVAKTKADLERELADQISLLQHACNSYDNGLKAAGKHIALSLRVLLHHQGMSKSLLEQLGMRSRRFYDTAGRLNERNLVSTNNLCGIRVGPEGAEHVPCILLGFTSSHMRRVLFPEWWNQNVIKDTKGRRFNRRELVLHVAETDGGAHVDPTLDEAYMELSRKNSLGWVVLDGNMKLALEGPELACMRQIAHEVLTTLQTRHPQYFRTRYDL